MVDNDNNVINKKENSKLTEYDLEFESKKLELLSLKVDIAERLSNLGVPELNTKYILKMLGVETRENTEPINILSTGTAAFTAPVAPTTYPGSVTINNIPSASWKRELTFAALRQANLARIPLFKNAKGEQAHSQSDGSDWSLAEWCNAVCGELGEAANIIKKIGRGDFTLDEAREELAKEYADIVVYLDILAMRTGVDLGDATVKKFNEVSERVGCEIFLSEQPNNLLDYYLTKEEEPKKQTSSQVITKEQAELCLIEEVLNVIDICKVSRIIVSNEVCEILKKAKEFSSASSEEKDFHNNRFTYFVGHLNECIIETPTLFCSQIPNHYIYKYGNRQNGSWILIHELSI